MIRLAVFDQSPATQGKPHDETLGDTVAFAIECERLGYHRYWLGEQHNNPSIVGSAPEILIAAIAARTRKIRVGSAGVLLSHYSPYKVAEQFRVLDALAPDRIDLGLGRAPGADESARAALGRDAVAAGAFQTQVAELLAWLYDEPIEEAPLTAQAHAFPRASSAPQPWILASSEIGAAVAAQLGLPLCFNYSADGKGHRARELLDSYRRDYRPTVRCPEPRAAILTWVLAAETQAEAVHLFASRGYWRTRLDEKTRVPLVSPETALAYPYSQAQRLRLEQTQRDCFVGQVDGVAEALTAVAAELGVQDLALSTWTYDPAARQRSFELLAKAFCLS